MSERKNFSRKDLESDASRALRVAQINSVVPYLMADLVSLFDKKMATQIYFQSTDSHRKRYHNAVRALRCLEAAENYPNVRTYTETIQDIVEHIPDAMRKQAYYPSAALDIFWSVGFENLLMEDVNYNTRQLSAQLWWQRSDYQTANLKLLVEDMKSAGIVPSNNEITFLQGNSDTSLAVKDLEYKPGTLICKSGQEQMGLVERHLLIDSGGQIGAVIAEQSLSLDKMVKKYKYEKIYTSKPAKVINPWVLSLPAMGVYINENR